MGARGTTATGNPIKRAAVPKLGFSPNQTPKPVRSREGIAYIQVWAAPPLVFSGLVHGTRVLKPVQGANPMVFLRLDGTCTGEALGIADTVALAGTSAKGALIYRD